MWLICIFGINLGTNYNFVKPKILFYSKKFQWSRERIASKFVENLGTSPLKGWPTLHLWFRHSSFSNFHYHTPTHHTQQESSARVISWSQIPLPDNAQHSQDTNIHDPGGIRTLNPSKRAAARARTRLRGRWDLGVGWGYILYTISFPF